MRYGSATPSLEISIAGMATPCTLLRRIIRRPPSPNYAGVHRFVLIRTCCRSCDSDQNGGSRRRSCGRTGYIEQRDPGYVAAVELGGVRTFLAVPMLKENELIGVFTVYRQEVRPFTDKQIELVRTSPPRPSSPSRTRGCSTSCANLLQQQTATADVLKVISRSTFDLQPVFETVVESCGSGCARPTWAFIFRFDGELLRLAAAFNASQEFKEFVEQNPIRPGRHSGRWPRRARKANDPHSRCLG